ncbi:hypothetical protein M0R04_14425 [Candidatus Dojkabacteria bacterium]|jgi:hypothetical protein|nr:hypothetical protein [Candidatus Dojkabacteria bacterium]
MNKQERTQFDLEMILPYVNHLKEVVNQDRRIERRKEQADWIRELSQPTVIFERPLTDVERLASVREELKRI